MNVRFRWIADVGECLLNTESGRSARKKGVLATHSEHENTRKNQIGTQEINVILYNPRSLNPG